MIKLFLDNKPIRFETTIFPDGTSQVWKLEEIPIKVRKGEILWMFENEAELFQVLQLIQLYKAEFCGELELFIPYLPYARQDKHVGSDATFALQTFMRTFNNLHLDEIYTIDVHSDSSNYLINSEYPKAFHDSLTGYDIICFPDKGARTRYGNSFKNSVKINCFKFRDQITGNLSDPTFANSEDGKICNNARILIVDDICDGGMTFIKVAELLKTHGASQIDLAVTHGLFSKGKQVLYDAGITEIFTTNSLLRNPDGFKVVPDDYLR